MKKVLKLDNFLIIAGVLLVIGFAVRLGADYYQYSLETDSNPFYLLILARAAVFLLPSCICFIISARLKRKMQAR